MSKTILALEWSSNRLSIAWQYEGTQSEEVLELKRFQAELVLPLLEKVVNTADGLSEIRIGRGPGNYSGIRQALAWSFGYSAPGEVKVKAYSSGVAQAERLSKTVDSPFAVLGDARRGVWWGRVFGLGESEWRMQSPEAWGKELATLPVYSQEASRLEQAPFDVLTDYPTAVDLLNLPDEFPIEETVPLYLHPAV